MLPYELIPEAEADLKEIARYTFDQWGQEQSLLYARQLENHFLEIAARTARSRNFSQKYPEVRVSLCRHHYIFFIHPEGKLPRIIAVLHERMDLLNRLGTRLD
jgi:toxin ParE1/3/4